MSHHYDITKRRSGYFFILILTLLVAGIISIGYFHYRNHERDFRAHIEKELSSIAKLKTDELALWRKERLAAGAILRRNSPFSGHVQRFLEKPDDPNERQQLQNWIDQFIKGYQYKGIILFDTQGVMRMLTPEDWNQVDAFSAEDIRKIMRQDKVDFLDLHRDSFDGPVHLSVVIPMFNGPDFSQPLGIIVFDIDPQTYLYPFIRMWPTPTQTAETILVRRDGDSVLLLNDLRFRKNTALNLRIPLTETKSPLVMAALGHEGVVEGVNYRGAPVIAAIKAVPNSPWYLVAETNESAVYEPLREEFWLMAVAVAGLLLGAGSAVFAAWRQRNLQYYRERLETAEALRESEELHRVIMETANDAIICVDQTGKVCLWNRRAEAMFGYTAQETQDKDVHDLIVPVKYLEQARAGLAKFWTTGAGPVVNKTTEITTLRRDGSEFPIELSIAAVKMRDGWGASAIIKDITMRKEWESKLTETNEKLKTAMASIEKTQKMLIRSEKLAAMGQLSAGVAHELKNPLNIIYTSTQLMMMEDGLTDDVAEAGKIIMEQVMRAVKIIDNLREFARERKPERKEVDLCQFIEKTLNLVAYEMKGMGIEIAMEFPPEPILIMGDVDQLAQVFLNITNNAHDSMSMKKNSLSFEEREIAGWKPKLTVRTQVEDGKAKICFEDNGVGISDENKRKLFTPFFTTKGEVKGTGLGVAIAFGIIENHGGTIDFESEEGKGAAFTVTLPLAG